MTYVKKTISDKWKLVSKLCPHLDTTPHREDSDLVVYIN
jgi:hypothetical protein